MTTRGAIALALVVLAGCGGKDAGEERDAGVDAAPDAAGCLTYYADMATGVAAAPCGGCTAAYQAGTVACWGPILEEMCLGEVPWTAAQCAASPMGQGFCTESRVPWCDGGAPQVP